MDEGALTYIMLLSCWKAICSPQLNQSSTTRKSFDRRGFKPYKILITLQVELARKIVSIEVEVIDRPLGYKILPGQT